MKNIQLLAVILACLGVAYYLAIDPPQTRIYSAGEINKAQIAAVQLARDGDLEKSAEQLRTLLKYAPKKQTLWIDYLTVLHWDGQNKLALSYLKKVKLDEAPDYFLSAMFNAAQSTETWGKLLAVSQHSLSTKNQVDVEEKYWQAVDYMLAKNQIGHAKNLLQQIQQSPPLTSNDLYLLIKKYQILADNTQVKDITLALRQHPNGKKKLHKLWQEQQDALVKNQQPEQAIENIQAYIKNKPGEIDATSQLIRIQKNRVVQSQLNRNWTQALTRQQQLIRLQKNTDNFKQWADINRKIKPAEQQLVNYQNLLWQYPNNQWLIGDAIAAFSQQGRYTAAVKMLPRLQSKFAASHVLEHAAYSARQVQRPEQALNLYTTGAQRFPKNIQFHLGRALSLLDQNKSTAAGLILESLSEKNPKDLGIRSALAACYAAQGKTMQELLQYQAILQYAPDNADAYRKSTLLTLEMGSTETAFNFASLQPTYFSKQDWKRLYSDRAAIAIRWANLYEPKVTLNIARIATAELYLQELKDYLGKHFPSDYRAQFNADNDYLLMLSLRQEHAAVIKQYKKLKASSFDMPPASQRIAAKAYLALQQPRESLKILNTLSEINNEVLSQKYYAYLDTNQPLSALAVARQKKELNPIWLASAQSKFLEGNSNRLQVDINEKLYPVYMSRLDESQQQLELFLRQGPANTEIRNHLATIYRWRGWPRKSQRQIDLIHSSEPAFLSAQTNAIYNDIAIYDYQEIDSKIDRLEKNHYRSSQVESLKKDWQLEKMASIEVTASAAQASGSRFSSRDNTLEGRLTSALFNQHFRLFTRALYKTNNQTQGGSFKRLGLGAQWRSRNIELSSEASQSSSGGNAGLAVAASWLKDDHWTLAAELQSYSDQTPLRAFALDIKMSSYAININHASHESLNSNLNLSLGDFSDGNQRLQLSASHSFALQRSIRHQTDARLNLGWQSNNKNNANYFNPSTLTSLSAGLDYTGTLQRHYNQFFKHQASLNLGLQSQAGFGQDIFWGIGYQHLWQKNKRLNGSYGVSYSQPIFDGERENNIGYFAQMKWKF